MNTLNKCPFCGGEAEVKSCLVYGVSGIVVSCTTCKAAIPMTLSGKSSGYGIRPDTYRTMEDCEAEAVQRWNRRSIAV